MVDSGSGDVDQNLSRFGDRVRNFDETKNLRPTRVVDCDCAHVSRD
jgi:hypothetical protein